MSFREFVLSVETSARAAGINVPMAKLRDAIAIACHNRTYSACLAAEEAGSLPALTLPPRHLEAAALQYRIPEISFLQAFRDTPIAPSGQASVDSRSVSGPAGVASERLATLMQLVSHKFASASHSNRPDRMDAVFDEVESLIASWSDAELLDVARSCEENDLYWLVGVTLHGDSFSYENGQLYRLLIAANVTVPADNSRKLQKQVQLLYQWHDRFLLNSVRLVYADDKSRLSRDDVRLLVKENIIQIDEYVEWIAAYGGGGSKIKGEQDHLIENGKLSINGASIHPDTPKKDLDFHLSMETALECADSMFTALRITPSEAFIAWRLNQLGKPRIAKNLKAWRMAESVAFDSLKEDGITCTDARLCYETSQVEE